MHLPDLITTIPPELRDYIRDLEERAFQCRLWRGGRVRQSRLGPCVSGNQQGGPA